MWQFGYTPIHFYKRVAMDYTGLFPVRLLGCLTFPQSVCPFEGLNYHEILSLYYTTLLELFIHLVARWLGKMRTKWTVPKSWGQHWITTDKGRGWLEKDAFFSECPLILQQSRELNKVRSPNSMHLFQSYLPSCQQWITLWLRIKWGNKINK